MKKKTDLSFVDRYRYPPRIKDQFAEMLSLLDGARVKSVILTGSTSRGELSYSAENGGVTVFSDYELMIVAEGRVEAEDRERLRNDFRRLERKFSRTPLFHIDFSCVSVPALRNLPPHLKHYETAKNGLVIYGEDVKPLLPRITPANLDFRDLNEILIWRLWAILLYLPAAFADGGKLTPEEENAFRYVVCRNLLDLPTWLLPWKGVLLASFRERAAYLNAHFPELKDGLLVDEEFRDLMNECLAGKLELKFRRGAGELYAAAVSYFEKAKDRLLAWKGFGGRGGEGEILEKRSARLFPDGHYRRKGYETIYFLRHYREMGLGQGLRWIFTGKYGLMLDFLLSVHSALASRLAGRGDEIKYLARAHSILRRLDLTRPPGEPNPENFSRSWLALRRNFAVFLMGYFRSVGMKSEYLNSLLN